MRNFDRDFRKNQRTVNRMIGLSLFMMFAQLAVVVFVIVAIVTHAGEIKTAGLNLITEISKAISEGQK